LTVGLIASSASLALLSASSLLASSKRSGAAAALGELLAAVPRLPLLVFLSGLFMLGPAGVALLVGILSSAYGLRTVARDAERLSASPFFLSSLASGAGALTAWRLHVLRNQWSLLAGYAGLSAATAVYADAALSLLGLSDPSSPGVAKLAFLVLSTPGAVLTPAGMVQVLASALATVLVAYASYWVWKGPLSRLF